MRTQALIVRPSRARTMARALGWLSIGLGLAEVFAPGTVRQARNVPARARLLGVFGSRDISSGIAILTADRPASMVWSRVAGDIMDLVAFAPSLRGSRAAPSGSKLALAALMALTALDIYVALQGDDVEDDD